MAFGGQSGRGGSAALGRAGPEPLGGGDSSGCHQAPQRRAAAGTRFCEGFRVEAAFTLGLKSRVAAQEAEAGSFFLKGLTGRASGLWAKRQS